MRYKLLHLQSLVAVALCVIMSMALAACDGDDDDQDPEPTPITTVAMTDFGGTRLMAVGPYTLSYDSKGRLATVKYYGDYEYFQIDYAKGLIVWDDDEEGDVRRIEFNSKGYVSKISESWDFIEDGEYCVGSTIYTYTYNSQGYLIKRDGSIKHTHVDVHNGKTTWSETGEWNITLTWSNGNLVKVFDKSDFVEDGEMDSSSYTYYLTYSDKTNAFKQYTYCLMDELEICDGYDVFFTVGLLGKGPANLPISIACEEDSFYSSMTYTLNANGSIASETFDGSTSYYSYRSIDDSRASYVDEQQQPTPMRARRVKHGRHNRHNLK